jgi:phosphopantothenoylcysteine decarboxylase / phosphopantothenate---cysteine ligase
VAEGSGTFGGAENEVHIVTASGAESWPRMSKPEVARKLIELVAARLGSAQ